MRNSARKLLRPVFAAATAAMMVGSVGIAAAGQSSHNAVEGATAKISKRQHGRRGPRGPRGPQGPPGPRGVAAPLIFKAQNPTFNTRIFEGGGLLINASCNPNTSLTGVSEIAGSVVRATDVVTGASEPPAATRNSTILNQNIGLTPGGAENNYVLTYLGGNGSSIITANYGLANNGMSLVNVVCAVFGTIQTATG